MYPDLWAWLIEGPEHVRWVIDVGCGDGSALDIFNSLGAAAYGIDGLPPDRPDIITHDFTTGPLTLNTDKIDLVWSAEFVEHLEEQYLPNALPALCAGRLLAMTHAVPGQPGWHHVNCQDDDYWIAAVEEYGTHRLDERLTAKARKLAAKNKNPANYFVKSGLVFRRSEC
jgi:hypothetical protein